MESFIWYILISTSCLSIFYLAYLFFQKKADNFHSSRYFLLISMFLSLIMPLSNYHIDLKLSIASNYNEQRHTELVSTEVTGHSTGNIREELLPESDRWNIRTVLLIIYPAVTLFLVFRLLIHFLKILLLYRKCERIKEGRIIILSNNNIRSPFSFFNWIFVPPGFLKDNENNDILTHERIHASQYHSFDLILIELISAVMWFNPLVRMMKKSVELVHEYLADEGVLSTGTCKLRYQALLLNQVAEERLICLSSNFNHSLIKKRMIMMTKSKFNQGSKLRILALIPLATLLFFGVACVNGQEADNPDVFTVIVDAGHGGKDPGAKPDDKITEKDLSLSIAKILQEKALAKKKINVILTREKDEFLGLNDRIKQQGDLFISVHINSSDNENISGIECFIPENQAYQAESIKYGTLIVNELSLLKDIKTCLPLTEENFVILRESKCPVILLNIGYLSNKNDLSFITDVSNQALICEKILDAVSL